MVPAFGRQKHPLTRIGTQLQYGEEPLGYESSNDRMFNGLAGKDSTASQRKAF
jgi:hypothetical protein